MDNHELSLKKKANVNNVKSEKELSEEKEIIRKSLNKKVNVNNVKSENELSGGRGL